MKPLVLSGGAAETAFWILLWGWLLGEGAWALRTTMRDPETRDATEPLLTGALLGGIGVGILLAYETTSLDLPGPRWWPAVAGLAVFAAGLSIRVWSIRTLGRFFIYTVRVEEGHSVVDTGPYSAVRHPSYTGL